MDERQGAAGDDDAACDLLARVVLGPRARAHVHDLGGDVGVLAVVGEGHRQVGEARQHPGPRPHLLEDRLLRRPAEVAPEVGVPRFAVGREALDWASARPGGLGAGAHGLGGGRESGRAVDAVEASEGADRLEDGDSVHLGGDRPGNLVGPERDAPPVRGQRTSARTDEQEGDGRGSPHHGPDPRRRVASLPRDGDELDVEDAGWRWVEWGRCPGCHRPARAGSVTRRLPPTRMPTTALLEAGNDLTGPELERSGGRSTCRSCRTRCRSVRRPT